MYTYIYICTHIPYHPLPFTHTHLCQRYLVVPPVPRPISAASRLYIYIKTIGMKDCYGVLYMY